MTGPIVRTLEVVELLDEPWHLDALTPAWRDRVRGLVEFTGRNHEDIWDCDDCGGQDPTPVGYRFVEATPEGPEFEWHPTVGVLEVGTSTLRWLCPECGQLPEPPSRKQIDQARRALAAGVRW